jgi:ribosome recycling factor
MIQHSKSEAQTKMEKAIQVLKKDLLTFRTGRANPSILDKVVVEYYGSEVPIHQLASFSTPDSRTLLLQPWDKSALAEIERAILKSEIGLTPNNDGSVIRIPIPPLTEERRNELMKLVRKTGEEAKVAIRNVRRDANEEIKRAEKSGETSEDVARRSQEEIQKLTDRFSKEADQVVTAKEKEMMEI